MTNEELILQKLDEIQKDVAGLKQDVAVLKQDVAELKLDVAVLKEDVAEIKETLNNHTIALNTLIEWAEAVAVGGKRVCDKRGNGQA